MKTVIYHDRCPDGFAAALAAHLALAGEPPRYLGASHGDPAPEIAGGEVFVLDFSYPLATMQRLAECAERLVWLDHHASVLDMREAFVSWLATSGNAHKVHAVVDLDHSGAALAWDHFFPDRPLPRLFRHVEDRDLWRWALPETAGFTAALDDLPFDLGVWSDLLVRMQDDRAYVEFVRHGEIGHRKVLRLCADIAARAEPIEIGTARGLHVNASSDFASQVGNLLAEKSGQFGLVWHVRDGMLQLSFRGAPGFNVIPLAARFGGGGHPGAAGARVALDRLGEILGTTVTAGHAGVS
jgi:oligoribonuclease NrnB/cAMP/cGMP phosphodiesterase (DHH superfamily)